jgi:hypothetical protein
MMPLILHLIELTWGLPAAKKKKPNSSAHKPVSLDAAEKADYRVHVTEGGVYHNNNNNNT